MHVSADEWCILRGFDIEAKEGVGNAVVFIERLERRIRGNGRDPKGR